ncbi:MAG: class I SAM-dependent methyltransferase [Sedimentisphaerales bacterium]|nr:class I SAM-dependent methyltransferase [Sedimentisphaerales bacterium]
MNIFIEIHSDNPREGPGHNDATSRAYSRLKNLPARPKILDVGCGPGMQTLELARRSDGDIVALDNHQPFLDYLNNQAAENGLAGKITAVNGSMSALPFDKESFDIIWSEGAIYIMGFEKGLRAWRPILKADGYIVVSELAWIKANPPVEIDRFLTTAYPAIKTIEENIDVIKQCDYSLVHHFILDESGWWNYYQPIRNKIARLQAKYKDDPEALNILKEEKIEIEMYQKYSQWYGYVFFIMQKKT